MRAIAPRLDAARCLDRRDAFVAARASSRAAGFGAGEEARGWLRPFWDRLAELGADERAVLALALADATPGLGVEWLPRSKRRRRPTPASRRMGFAVGMALAERQLWGKARRLLEDAAAADTTLRASARRKPGSRWRASPAEEGDSERAARAYESAAILA